MRTVDVSLAAPVLALGLGGAASAAHLETVNPADSNFTLPAAPPASTCRMTFTLTATESEGRSLR